MRAERTLSCLNYSTAHAMKYWLPLAACGGEE